MDWREFIASLVGSVAWPVTAAIVAWLFRRQIGALIEGPVKRLKAGPLELEFAEAAVEVVESVAVAAPPASQEEEVEFERLTALADQAPAAAIVESFSLVEEELHAMANARGLILPRNAAPGTLINWIEDHQVVSAKSANAVRGLATVRNLAARGRSDETPDRAREYVAMTQAVLFAMRQRPASGTDAAPAD